MDFFLIRITPGKWYAHDGVPWLEEGEVQADALWDLRVSSNSMSAWHIENNKSNLGQVVAALAGTRNALVEFGYALLDKQMVLGLDIKAQLTPGDSKDPHANGVWHYNFIELKASQIYCLTEEIKKKENRNRFHEWEVKAFLEEGVKSGRIKFDTLDPNIQKKLSSNLIQKTK